MTKIAHIAVTPLAGSPIRIVDALNKYYENNDVRLITLFPDAYGKRVFKNDLVWNTQKEECLYQISNSDVLHFHHYFDLRAGNPFDIDFLDIAKETVKIIRQFHSHPLTVARGSSTKAKELIKDPIPSLVVAQFHERYYPYAKLVPNIVPINDSLYERSGMQNLNAICFSPGVSRSAWNLNKMQTRWDTKGVPETLNIVSGLKSQIQELEFFMINGKPYEDCIRIKKTCGMAIDELVTGSYHLSGLESLAAGVATLSYLDDRTQYTIRRLTGAEQLPWVNCRLEDTEYVIYNLFRDKDLLSELGVYSRIWMEKHWDEKNMTQHYIEAYEDVLNDTKLMSKPRFDSTSSFVTYFNTGLYDDIYSSRRKRCYKLKDRARNNVFDMARRLYKYMRKTTSRAKSLSKGFK